MDQSYGRQFHIRRFRTYDLQKPGVLGAAVALGYRYVRRVVKEYVDIIRNPTVGCIVELSYTPTTLSVPIASREGMKIIRRQSYF